MSWSADFLAALERRQREMIFILRVLPATGIPGTAYAIATHAGYGDGVGLSMRGSTVSGATVNPRAWTSIIGAFEVVLVGDFLAPFCAHATRGTLMSLEAGFAGWDEADFQRVALGALKSVRGTAPRWVLQMWDVFSAFRHRATVLYGAHRIGASRTQVVDAPFDPATDTTLRVDDSTTFRRETGGPGLLQVSPSSGSPYYLRWTGAATGPHRFTGIGTDRHGTTSVAADYPDVVTECLYVEGHPCDIVRKICISTGTGAAGTYDTLPEGWALGMPDEVWDHDDVDATRTLIGSDHEWEVLTQGDVNDSLSWLQGHLAKAGLVITQRQGAVTIRATQDSSVATPTFAITDADLEAVEDWETWAPDHTNEWGAVQAVYDVDSLRIGTSAADLATLPAGLTTTMGGPGLFVMNMGDLLFSGTAVAACDEVLSRVEECARRVPERMRVRCVGLRLAAVTPLDVGTLTTTRIHSKTGGAAGYSARRVVVVAVSPDWVGGRVVLELRVYPLTEDAFA